MLKSALFLQVKALANKALKKMKQAVSFLPPGYAVKLWISDNPCILRLIYVV